jgi:hypothetical protein
MIGPDDFATLLDAVLVLLVFWAIAAHFAARFLGDVVAFALSKWPAYRAWRRKQNRIERLEWAAFMAERRTRTP